MKTAGYDSHISKTFKGKDVCKIFGPAGTGKTTFLVSELKKIFSKGVKPERVAFVSFTNRAVGELVERCLTEFPHITRESFPHFRTIHSLCYRNMSGGRKVITQKEIFKLATEHGLEMSAYKNIEEGSGTKRGDKATTIDHLSRLRMIPLKQQWEESNFAELPFAIVEGWQNNYFKYKNKNNLIDFTDMLFLYESVLDVDYIFIDECQDLSPLQWNVMDTAARDCKKIFIAGDDDQSIYSWAGAEVDYILKLKSKKDIILPKSYRLPKAIYDKSQKILKRINNRKNKKYTHNGKEGTVDSVFDFRKVNYKKEKDCLILTRNRWQLKEIKEYLEGQGFPYYLFNNNSLENPEVEALIYWEHFRSGKELLPKQFKKMIKLSKRMNKFISLSQIPEDFINMKWFEILDLISLEKRNYIRRVLQHGYKLFDKPHIKLSTIHQAKGGEADTVVLLTDVSNVIWERLWHDDEHRVWYVAVTRAKNKLIIVQEQSNKFYKI